MTDKKTYHSLDMNINKERIRTYLDGRNDEAFILRSPHQFEGTIESITVREIKPLGLPLDARLQYQMYLWSFPIRWLRRWLKNT